MRIHPAQTVERRARQRQQVMHDRQLDFGDDGQVVREQQVVVTMDAAADRVFDRYDAVSGRVGIDGLEHLFEGAARDQLRVRIDPSRGSLAEGARLALVCDFHRSSSITHGGPPRSQIDNLYKSISDRTRA
jgi:hypothetical protein